MRISVEQRERIITNYINAYNSFDIRQMVADFDSSIVFENRSNEVVTMTLRGINAFMEQATQALTLFSKRTQTILSFTHKENTCEVDIRYEAQLAMDLPNGLKKGEELHLTGKSVFTFSENKVIGLTDIS